MSDIKYGIVRKGSLNSIEHWWSCKRPW